MPKGLRRITSATECLDELAALPQEGDAALPSDPSDQRGFAEQALFTLD